MSSARAAIFKEILPYINNGDWDRVGDSIVFGKKALDSYIEDGSADESDIAIAVRKLQDANKRKYGRAELLARTSLYQPPPDEVDNAVAHLSESLNELIERLSQQERKTLLDKLQASAQEDSRQPTVSNALGTADLIDTALAERMIAELQSAHTRAIVLNKIPFTAKSGNLAALLDEAHRCDLAGLKFATAILCRAVLEDSLTAVLDPKRQIRGSLKPDESYIGQLLDEANKKKLIDDERVNAGKLIRDAGNHAVHNPSQFKSKYWMRTSELVDGMRKILEDLHRTGE